MRITLLGTGTSTGVPIIGCPCSVCHSKDPRDQRTRTSLAIVTEASKVIIIDTTPEFRIQMLRENLTTVDSVLYTHIHADHCHGFDDLRAIYFRTKRSVPCYLPQEMMAEFRSRFDYAFRDTGYLGTKPQVELIATPEGTFSLHGLEFEAVRLPHGSVSTVGFRSGRFAYATDFKAFPDHVIEAWRGKIDVMVASGIHFGQHPTHSVIPETTELFKKLGVKRGILTHLAHDVDIRRDLSRLPAYVEFGYDGLSFEINGGN